VNGSVECVAGRVQGTTGGEMAEAPGPDMNARPGTVRPAGHKPLWKVPDEKIREQRKAKLFFVLGILPIAGLLGVLAYLSLLWATNLLGVAIYYLLMAVILGYFYSKYRQKFPRFIYQVYEDGFVYPMMQAGFGEDNFIPFEDVRSIRFDGHGFGLLLKFEGREDEVDVDAFDGIKPYLIIARKMMDKFHPKAPDLTIVERYFDPQNDEDRKAEIWKPAEKANAEFWIDE